MLQQNLQNTWHGQYSKTFQNTCECKFSPLTNTSQLLEWHSLHDYSHVSINSFPLK